MFNGLRNLLTRKASVIVSPEVQRAYDMGRDIGDQFTAEAVAYVDARSLVIEKNFLEVLQKQIDTARYQEEHSPMLVARVEYEIFVENVSDSIEKLFDETKLVLREWDEVHAAISMTAETDHLIKQLVEAKLGPLKLLGLKTLLQNVDILKRADENWRLKFPELSRLEPLPS